MGGILSLFSAATLAGVIGKHGFPLPDSHHRIGCVDGVRGYLALCVMIHHFVIWLQITRLKSDWIAPDISPLDNLGKGSVVIFFMITGMLFYRFIINGFTASEYISFIIKRIFRLLPIIILSILIILSIIYFRTGQYVGKIDIIPLAKWMSTYSTPDLANYHRTSDINARVIWSLYFEWKFYICVVPIMASFVFVLRRFLPNYIFPLSLFILSMAARPYISLWGMATYLPLFAAGMLIFELQNEPIFKARLQTSAAAIVGMACLAIALSSPMDVYAFPNILLYATFLLPVACGNSYCGLFSHRGSLVLGECSYGIYALHGILLSTIYVEGHVVVSQLPTSILPYILPAISIIIVLFTLLTFILIERPAIKVGKHFARLWKEWVAG
jgi:peptidoglycan/LPS O-acetylase OafA/YrhL